MRVVRIERLGREGDGIAGSLRLPFAMLQGCWILIRKRRKPWPSISQCRRKIADPHDHDVGARDAGRPKGRPDKEPKDPKKHGQQANTKQNTTHQGYQQDR